MNEPFTNSRPEASFCGKAHNNHPQWYNQPLRLTKEQNRDPLLVFYNFFRCYHLNEVREILWQWTSAIVSSPGSISSEPLERSNHLYFYEKIEELAEAAFILKKRTQKHRRKQEKRKLKAANNIIGSHNVNLKKPAIAAQAAEPKAGDNIDKIFNKEKRLIEYAEEDPIYVIKKVFSPNMEFTSDQLIAWLHIGLTAECMAYNYAEDREQLKNFHDDLLTLTDALYVIYSGNTEKEEGENLNRCAYRVSVLSQDQIANPENTIKDFFKKYPRTYIERELEDWLEAAICYTGEWPNDLFCRPQLLDTHRCIQCLIKAAGQLLSKD